MTQTIDRKALIGETKIALESRGYMVEVVELIPPDKENYTCGESEFCRLETYEDWKTPAHVSIDYYQKILICKEHKNARVYHQDGLYRT